MIRSDYIRLLYQFNRWANDQVLAAASRLTPTQFTEELGGSYPSIPDTLVHTLTGEWIWLERWRGKSPTEMLHPNEFPTMDELRRSWEVVERDQMAFVEALNAPQLDRVVRYVNTEGQEWQYPLWQMMVHVVNHSTYHRGQVATMMRQLGAEPCATDFLFYFDAQASHPLGQGQSRSDSLSDSA